MHMKKNTGVLLFIISIFLMGFSWSACQPNHESIITPSQSNTNPPTKEQCKCGVDEDEECLPCPGDKKP